MPKRSPSSLWAPSRSNHETPSFGESSPLGGYTPTKISSRSPSTSPSFTDQFYSTAKEMGFNHSTITNYLSKPRLSAPSIQSLLDFCATTTSVDDVEVDADQDRSLPAFSTSTPFTGGLSAGSDPWMLNSATDMMSKGDDAHHLFDQPEFEHFADVCFVFPHNLTTPVPHHEHKERDKTMRKDADHAVGVHSDAHEEEDVCKSDVDGTPQKRSDGEEKIIWASSYILALKSEVFKAMISANMQEAQYRRIVITDVDYEDFRVFVRFLHTNEANVKAQNVLALLYLSKKYGVPMMKTICMLRLNTFITVDNAIEVLEPMVVSRQDEEVIAKVLEVFDADPSACIENADLEDVSYPTIKAIIDRNALTMSEADAYELAVQWANARVDETLRSVRERVTPLFQYIRFPQMSPEFLVKTVHPSGLVDPDIIIDALSWHTSYRNAIAPPGRVAKDVRYVSRTTAKPRNAARVSIADGFSPFGTSTPSTGSSRSKWPSKGHSHTTSLSPGLSSLARPSSTTSTPSGLSSLARPSTTSLPSSLSSLSLATMNTHHADAEFATSRQRRGTVPTSSTHHPWKIDSSSAPPSLFTLKDVPKAPSTMFGRLSKKTAMGAASPPPSSPSSPSTSEEHDK